jgi:hypothetical protein
MNFQPTPEEESVGITHIDNGSYDLNSTTLAVPSSKWNDVHLKALRVVLLDGLPVSRLFPSEYLPSESHPGGFDVNCSWIFHSYLQCTMI